MRDPGGKLLRGEHHERQVLDQRQCLPELRVIGDKEVEVGAGGAVQLVVVVRALDCTMLAPQLGSPEQPHTPRVATGSARGRS